MPVDIFINIAELCRQLCMSRSAVYQRQTTDPAFPRIIKAGKKTLFSQEQTEQWKRARIEEAAGK